MEAEKYALEQTKEHVIERTKKGKKRKREKTMQLRLSEPGKQQNM